VRTGRLLRTFSPQNGAVTSVSFSRDDTTFAVTTINGSLTFWSIATEKQLGSASGAYLTYGTSDPSGYLYATAPYEFVPMRDASAQIWNLERRLAGPTLHNSDDVRAVVFNPQVNQRQIATLSDREVRLWSVNGKLLKVYRTTDARDKVVRATFTPDGTKLAVTYSNGAIRLWDARPSPFGGVSEGEELSNIEPIFPDTRHVAVASPGSLRVLAFPSLQEESARDGEWTTPRAISIADDKALLVAEGDGFAPALTVWNLSGGVRLGSCRIGRIIGSNGLAAFGARGAKIAAGPDKFDPTIHMCDSKTGKEERTFHVPAATTSESAIAFSRGGRYFAAGGVERTVAVWDVAVSEPLATYSADKARVSSLAFSPDESLMASGFDDGSVVVWDVKAKRKRFSIKLPVNVTAVAIDGAGQILATEEKTGIIHLWDLSSGASVAVFQGAATSVKRLVFSPDNGFVVALIDNRLWRWKIASEIDLTTWLMATDAMEKNPPVANKFSPEQLAPELWPLN
jgi:WD40 repeat protein